MTEQQHEPEQIQHEFEGGLDHIAEAMGGIEAGREQFDAANESFGKTCAANIRSGERIFTLVGEVGESAAAQPGVAIRHAGEMLYEAGRYGERRASLNDGTANLRHAATDMNEGARQAGAGVVGAREQADLSDDQHSALDHIGSNVTVLEQAVGDLRVGAMEAAIESLPGGNVLLATGTDLLAVLQDREAPQARVGQLLDDLSRMATAILSASQEGHDEYRRAQQNIQVDLPEQMERIRSGLGQARESL